MTLVKVVFVAVVFSLSGSALAATGEFRETGDEFRAGQMVCASPVNGELKRAPASSEKPAHEQKAAEVANVNRAT